MTKPINVDIYEHTNDAAFNTRCAIEQLIYALADNNLATAKVISEALKWWADEVYNVLGEEPDVKEMH